MEDKKESWASRNSSALITAASVIAAALITGYFSLSSSPKETTPKIETGNISKRVEVKSTPKEVVLEPSSTTKGIDSFDLEKYQELYQFAYSASGMNMTTVDANKFADKWFLLCADKDISVLIESYKFAYSASGMNKTTADARKWALKSVDCDIDPET